LIISYFGWESHKECIPEGKELRLDYKLRDFGKDQEEETIQKLNKINRAVVDLNSNHI
jgi:hypothetical protein